MRWLVQEFLNNASNMVRIITALESLRIEYLLIKVNTDNTLTVLEKKSKLPIDDSDILLQQFITNEQVMVYGSKTFANIAKDIELQPGSFMNENFEFDVFRNHLGSELLNYEFSIGELWELKPIADEFFIRPTGNTKLFTGMAITKEGFLAWQKREQIENSPYIGQTLMISPIQEIEAEYRFFVVNQEIVTCSSYKVGKEVDISLFPSEGLIKYTNRMIEKFPLAEAFVIDVAVTKNGYKVVEYNNLNTSGLYGCNENALVRAINQLDEKAIRKL